MLDYMLEFQKDYLCEFKDLRECLFLHDGKAQAE